MRKVKSRVFGSRTAVAITSVIVTTVVIAGGVASASVANNSVTTPKIRNGAITTPKIANNAVTSAKIRNGTIQGIDIKDGTITGANIADDTITGADIADGSVSAKDIAPADATAFLAGDNDDIQLITGSIPANASPFANFQTGTNCPVGNRAIGGGTQEEPTQASTGGQWLLTGSYPDGQGWRWQFQTADGSARTRGIIPTWVLCAPA